MQWLSSEREKRSVIPPMFWYFSIGGGLILLAYAFYRRDVVFILGQSSGMFIYARNLQLIRNEKRRIVVDTPAPKSEIIQITATVQQRNAA
ncbi:MAG: lipid-A-disaccharide synthase N-terminal domain-containing protein [Planctomycetaceae bacterium]